MTEQLAFEIGKKVRQNNPVRCLVVCNYFNLYVQICPIHNPRALKLLILVRGSKPGKNVQLTENEIKSLCIKSRDIFLSQPILLELEAPLKICGIYPIINV